MGHSPKILKLLECYQKGFIWYLKPYKKTARILAAINSSISSNYKQGDGIIVKILSPASLVKPILPMLKLSNASSLEIFEVRLLLECKAAYDAMYEHVAGAMNYIKNKGTVCIQYCGAGWEKDIFPYCIENNIGVVPFSPVASGFLSGMVNKETKFEGDDVRKFVPQLSKENIDKNQPVLDILSNYAKKKGATLAQISLSWMLKKYPNVVPIPGSKNKERILENLASSSVTLSDEEFSSLEKELSSISIYGHRGHVETEQTSFGRNWRK